MWLENPADVTKKIEFTKIDWSWSWYSTLVFKENQGYEWSANFKYTW